MMFQMQPLAKEEPALRIARSGRDQHGKDPALILTLCPSVLGTSRRNEWSLQAAAIQTLNINSTQITSPVTIKNSSENVKNVFPGSGVKLPCRSCCRRVHVKATLWHPGDSYKQSLWNPSALGVMLKIFRPSSVTYVSSTTKELFLFLLCVNFHRNCKLFLRQMECLSQPCHFL